MLVKLSKILALCLVVTYLVMSCGINVGNPKKPDDDDDTETNQSDQVTYELIEWHFEETLTAVYNSVMAFNAGALNKVVFGAIQQDDDPEESPSMLSCQVEADGSVKVTVEFSETRPGRVSDELESDASQQIVSNTKEEYYWRDHSGAVRCETAGQLAVDFDLLESLSIDYTIVESATQSDTNTGEVVWYQTDQETISVQWETISRDDATGLMTIQQSINFEVQKVRTLEEGGTPVKNTAVRLNTPIVLTSDYLPSESRWSNVKILEGQILSQDIDGQEIETTYSDLSLGVSGSCLPDSGEIAGTYRANQAAEPEAFKIGFENGEAFPFIGDTRLEALDSANCER